MLVARRRRTKDFGDRAFDSPHGLVESGLVHAGTGLNSSLGTLNAEIVGFETDEHE